MTEARQALIVASLVRAVHKLGGGREDLENRDRRSDVVAAFAAAGHAGVGETAGPLVDADQEIAAVRLAPAVAQAALEGGEQVDLDVVMVLAAARHHHEAAADEFVALAPTLHPREEVLDVGKHRLRSRGGFGHVHSDSALNAATTTPVARFTGHPARATCRSRAEPSELSFDLTRRSQTDFHACAA
jgi:hypothetical protein